MPDTEPPSFRSLYASSLLRFPDDAAAARIRVEEIPGDVLLVAGGDDQVWPSVDFARSIERDRAAAGLRTTVVTHPDAGHRLLLPGEAPAAGGIRMARGGTPEADAALGAAAWPEVLRMLKTP
jgi:dienelactone hydrolase